MRIRASSFILALVLGFASASVQAVPISYDEVPDGDLDGSQTLVFDVGTNTVTGSSSQAINFNTGFSPGDSDPFRFVIPTGQQLTSVLFTYAIASIDNILNREISRGLSRLNADSSFTFIVQDFTQIFPVATDPSPDPLFVGTVLGADTYFFSQGGSTQTGPFQNGIGSIQHDYRYSFEVTSVPEPGTLALLSAGLFGLFMRRKRVA